VGVWGSGSVWWTGRVSSICKTCLISLLKRRRRELRKPQTVKAGRIPLAGLVLVHSRHNRDFKTRSRRPQVQKSRILSGAVRPLFEVHLVRFLGAVQG